MKISKQNWILSAAVVLFIVVVVFAVSSGNGNEKQQQRSKFKEFEVRRGDFKVLVTANGVVIPIDRVEIKSKASGLVEELPVEEGDLVKAGDLIARLDQKDERAAVSQAQADYDISVAELNKAQREYDRLNKLFEENLISEEERDQIVLNLAVAKGKMIQATTALERAKERLSESIVRAPIDGVILQKYVEKGQIIASGINNVSGGTPIVDIADMSSVYIEAGIDEIDIGKIRAGQKAHVIADAYPGKSFYGKIVRIAPEARVDQNVTLFDVVVEVENREGLLKSGMNTSLEITIINKKDVLLAPAVAVQKATNGKRSKGNPRVLLKQNGEFIPREIKIGLMDFKNAEILEGLKEGDTLGIPMNSRLKEANERLENRIRKSRSFGSGRR